MNTITLTTETETELTFTFTIDHAYMLTTPYGIDDPSDMLDLIFANDPSEPVTYTFSAFNNPNNYYFATRLAENGYGSDCADYEHIDDIAYSFGHPIADAIAAELTRRDWPLERAVDYFA
jgi:hypothetical protein